MMRDDAVRPVVLWLDAHGYTELAGAVWLAVSPMIPGPESLPDDMDDLVEEVIRGLSEAGYEDLAAAVGIVAAVVTTTSDPGERRELIGIMAALRGELISTTAALRRVPPGSN